MQVVQRGFIACDQHDHGTVAVDQIGFSGGGWSGVEGFQRAMD